MKLSERLRLQETGTPPLVPSTADASPAAVAPPALAPRPAVVEDAFSLLKRRVQEVLFANLGNRLFDASLGEDELRHLVTDELNAALAAESSALSSEERSVVVAELVDDVLGYGPIEAYLHDPEVSEIMVNGTSSIYVERSGRLHRTAVAFHTEDHLFRVIERIVGQVGRRIDESSPMVDARLPDGSRVNAIVPPLAVDGPSLTIRKFSAERWDAQDLERFGTFTASMSGLLERCVRGRLNILVSGGTGTGKTTLLNVLSSFIPPDERIVTIEDAVELRLQQDHVVRLESRPPNTEGKGRIEIRDLVRNALRMRPDRIIIGEVRGGEALDMLQAMNTGHDGSLGTLHANGPRDAVSRLETMVLMAGMDLPARAIREQLASALDLIVHISRLRDGTRRVTHVTEVLGMEGDVVTLQELFTFDHVSDQDADGRLLGSARPTGLRPMFSDRLRDLGIDLPPELLGAPLHVAARR